jgi:hypothetical protein
MTTAYFAARAETNFSATASPCTKPEQAAEMSKPQAFTAPSFAITYAEVDGICMSPVTVPTTTRPTSAGVMPASASARRAASTARSLVTWPSAAMCRWRMPVRSVIQASEVSTILARSSFVITRSGRYEPLPRMRAQP